MQHPKVVIVGAGSLFFGRKAIWQMVHSEALRGGTLALVDTDADRLHKLETLAEKVIAHNGVPLKLEASTERREVLEDADFVVLCFAHRNAHYRGVDCDISEKYGIRMCSGDTIGPGGVFRAARELPEIMRCCEDISELCPDAWVVNYINPTAVCGMAVARSFPKLKSLALCDAQFNLRRRYAEIAGVPNDEKLIAQPAGPNHFTWLLKAEYDGRDLIPRIVESARQNAEGDANRQFQGGSSHAKGYLNNTIAVELYDAFGVLPTVLGHTKEYVRFYQGLGKSGRDAVPPLKIFEVPTRVEWTNNVWQRVDDYISGTVDIAEFDIEFGPDPATDLIEGIWAGGRDFFVNTFNDGAVSNMADDAFLELWSHVSRDGINTHPIGPMPRGVRAMCETVLDTHELTAEAIVERDPAKFRRALLTDPLTSSIGDTDALIAELLEAEREALDPALYEALSSRVPAAA